ncbi:MAG: DNA-binding transcriptional regulator [Colwellia sp.]
MCEEKINITLLLNTNKIFDRKMIKGIGQYIKSTKINWKVCLEEDVMFSNAHLSNFSGDGIIASFDDDKLEQKLSHLTVPIVGLSGSILQQNNNLNIPYVATDNYSVTEMAYDHLKQKGLQNFAFYGLPHKDDFYWSIERENAFKTVLTKDNYQHHIFADSFESTNLQSLRNWLTNLPKPVGVICATDGRARQLIDACEYLDILVPEQVSIVGIDDDDISQSLSKIELSSVRHECKEMGFKATQLLHKLILGKKIPNKTVIKPTTINCRQSSDFISLKDPDVMQAMHFIQNNACRGIKVDQVLYHIGISRSTLEPRFIQERGHTIHTEIHNEKLTQACRQLISSSLTLSEVAKIAGYPSLQYMYSIFKKRFNQTPKEYRSINQHENDISLCG